MLNFWTPKLIDYMTLSYDKIRYSHSRVANVVGDSVKIWTDGFNLNGSVMGYLFGTLGNNQGFIASQLECMSFRSFGDTRPALKTVRVKHIPTVVSTEVLNSGIV